MVHDEALPVTPTGIISRDRDITIPLQCYMERDGTGSVSFHADTSERVFEETGYGKFNFQLQLYQTANYVNPYPAEAYPMAVEMREVLYFEAAVSAEPGLQLFVESCVATETMDPSSAPQYRFLDEG